ncbi:hypothetical protein [Sphingomonas sp. UNC305MFCol5.2]|uniref:hypothetical protein n=1 Tax=Sphingomonas sp. UNC305MFCol5.2 TaxID=1449076 RepID=UPI0004A75F26|nr:hypothetical protein [Sphingomonas sp. UNC305MFCol5.2]
MTVYRRTVTSVPTRSADDSWRVIVDLLAGTGQSAARDELLSVSGVASSIIADMAPQHSAIVSTCSGPRTRIYCVYDDDALDADTADESRLPHNAVEGDWRVSLPCLGDDLSWVSAALAGLSSRITARDASDKGATDTSESASMDQSAGAASGVMDIDLKGLFS